ncbi:RNA polymerase sigma factor [Streptomyces cavernae]|uniref:RNA polymerase sigma factor n=1 Tax=Streptomyces cavernae TaxID=2259034 RepID=UPI000FEBC10A|nr:sigma-70 family RNA polymerase sigma factor [Streptomyces cavernae]
MDTSTTSTSTISDCGTNPSTTNTHTVVPETGDWMTPEEFDTVFTAAMPRLRRRLLAMTGDPHDADDLLQETYVRLAHRAHTRRLARQRHTYAYTCVAALNLLRDSWQHSSRREQCSDRLPEQGWDGGLALREAESTVLDLLRSLSPKEAAAVILVDLEGLSHDTAGERLGAHRGTVQRNRMRGLAKIRTALGAYGPPPGTVASTKAEGGAHGGSDPVAPARTASGRTTPHQNNRKLTEGTCAA